MGIHSATARILDDMRLLFTAILSLSDKSPEQQVEGVKHMAMQIHDHIASLHDVLPDAPPGTPQPAPATMSSTPSSTASFSTHSSSSSSFSSQQPKPKFISQSHDPRHILLRNTPQPDFIYATVRQVALLYSLAASRQVSLSEICPVPRFMSIWADLWRVSMKRWHSLLGVFLWVVIALLPTGRQTQFASMVKSLLHIGTVQMGLDQWEVCIGMLRRAVGVVCWLADGREGDVEMVGEG